MSPLCRSAALSWFALMACTPASSQTIPPSPRAQDATPVSASKKPPSPTNRPEPAPLVSASTPPAVSAAETPPAEDPNVVLKRLLDPKPGSGLLLLGVHRENIEGYGPMFSSEGKPRTDTRPGYMTLVIRTQNGAAELLGTLSYIALPQGDRFKYIGESSVSVHLPDSPSVKMFDGGPMPRDYDATDLWTTDDRKTIPAAAEALAQKLKKKLSWGKEDTSQIIFVTPKALCKMNTRTEVTGGALYFTGITQYTVESMDGTSIDNNFAKHVSEPELIRFASVIFGIPLEDVDLDKPVGESFMVYSIRDDIQLCIDHGEGSTRMLGSILKSANSARSFSDDQPFGPAPEHLAPGNEAIPFAALKKLFPKAADAFISRSHDTLFILQPSAEGVAELAVWNALDQKISGTLPIPGRTVMVEWAMGDTAIAWEKQLRPALQRPAASAAK